MVARQGDSVTVENRDGGLGDLFIVLYLTIVYEHGYSVIQVDLLPDKKSF